MSHKRTGAIRVIFRLFLLMVMLGLLASPLGTVGAQETPPGETQVEVVSLSDLEAAAKLLSETIVMIDRRTNFIPQ